MALIKVWRCGAMDERWWGHLYRLSRVWNGCVFLPPLWLLWPCDTV